MEHNAFCIYHLNTAPKASITDSNLVCANDKALYKGDVGTVAPSIRGYLVYNGGNKSAELQVIYVVKHNEGLSLAGSCSSWMTRWAPFS